MPGIRETCYQERVGECDSGRIKHLPYIVGAQRMSGTPDISVLMPVYNAAETLRAAVSSICGQTETGWELVAVDDGSSDGSAAVLEEMALREPRLRVVRQERGGIARALRRGMEEAKAPLIARMDADDWSAPDRLKKQTAFLRENPGIGVVGCRVVFGGDAALSAGYAAHVDWTNGLVSAEEMALNRFVESPLAHPSVMFRADLARRFGGYREGDFPEDYELWLRWMENGVRFGKIPEPLLTWNDPPARLSRSDARYSVESFYRVKAEYLGRWLARHNRNHPRVVVVGSGRVTRRRVEMLIGHGVEVVSYVDIDPRKVGLRYHGVPVISPEAIPEAGSHFVVGYVGKRGARELIAGWLKALGYTLGVDWLPAA